MRRKVRNIRPDSPKISYHDLTTERPKDLMKKYKTDARGLERAVRDQAYSASKAELQSFYEKEVYTDKKR